jgi:hypothetical protein
MQRRVKLTTADEAKIVARLLRLSHASLVASTARREQRSWEDERLRRSIFSYVLIRALSTDSPLATASGYVNVGALTLLANIVMAWNTHHLQVMLDRAPGDHPDEVVSRLAPIGHKHINMRGILTFDLARYRSNLLRQPLSGAEDRVSS